MKVAIMSVLASKKWGWTNSPTAKSALLVSYFVPLPSATKNHFYIANRRYISTHSQKRCKIIWIKVSKVRCCYLTHVLSNTCTIVHRMYNICTFYIVQEYSCTNAHRELKKTRHVFTQECIFKHCRLRLFWAYD
jgi:hypothetical protein